MKTFDYDQVVAGVDHYILRTFECFHFRPSHTVAMSFRNSAPDRTVEVCREFMGHRCDRSENKCRYAHPPPHCHVEDGRVTCCVDHIKV